MVFPVENLDRTMRNLLMLFQDHQRLIVEIFRKVLVMIDNLVKGEMSELPDWLNQVGKLHDESIELRKVIMKELRESSDVLMDREDLYRLISKSGEVMDHSEGIGVRLWQISDRKWRIPEKVGKGLVELSEIAFETLTKVRESLLSLGLNPEKTESLIREVDEGELKIDSLYKMVDLDIITSKAKLPLILILRDITQAIEEMIDSAKEEADIISILAL